MIEQKELEVKSKLPCSSSNSPLLLPYDDGCPQVRGNYILSGLGRRPIAHTCDCTLELPTTYMNYDPIDS